MASTQELVSQVVAALLPILQLLVVALVGWAAKEVAGFIAQRIKNEALKAALDRLNVTVFDVVLDVEQTVVSKLKDASAGGKPITDAVWADVKDTAIAKVKALLGPAGIAKLLSVLGITDVDNLIATKVESHVAQLKRSKGDSK